MLLSTVSFLLYPLHLVHSHGLFPVMHTGSREASLRVPPIFRPPATATLLHGVICLYTATAVHAADAAGAAIVASVQAHVSSSVARGHEREAVAQALLVMLVRISVQFHAFRQCWCIGRRIAVEMLLLLVPGLCGYRPACCSTSGRARSVRQHCLDGCKISLRLAFDCKPCQAGQQVIVAVPAPAAAAAAPDDAAAAAGVLAHAATAGSEIVLLEPMVCDDCAHRSAQLSTDVAYRGELPSCSGCESTCATDRSQNGAMTPSLSQFRAAGLFL